MTDTATGSLNRAAALQAFLAGNNAGQEAPAPRIVRTGVVVPAGGDVERVLVAVTNLTYRSGEFLYRAAAEVGDTVLLLPEQAKRLDLLGATIDPHLIDEVTAATATTPVGEVPSAAAPADGTAWTDEQVKAAKAADLIAYVGQHPDERARVRILEEARGPSTASGKGQRTTVMNATEPTPLEDDEVAAKAAAQKEADDAAKVAAKAAEDAGSTPAPEAQPE